MEKSLEKDNAYTLIRELKNEYRDIRRVPKEIFDAYRMFGPNEDDLKSEFEPDLVAMGFEDRSSVLEELDGLDCLGLSGDVVATYLARMESPDPMYQGRLTQVEVDELLVASFPLSGSVSICTLLKYLRPHDINHYLDMFVKCSLDEGAPLEDLVTCRGPEFAFEYAEYWMRKGVDHFWLYDYLREATLTETHDSLSSYLAFLKRGFPLADIISDLMSSEDRVKFKDELTLYRVGAC